MSELEKKLKEFHSLIQHLSFHPLKNFKEENQVKLFLSYDEQQEFFYDLQAQFCVLYGEYDKTKGASFKTYIQQHLSWYAHHKAERMFDEKKLNILVEDDMDKYEANDSVEEEIDFSEEISFEMESYLDQLPPRCKYIMQQHFIYNRNLHDIADEMSIAYRTCLKQRSIGLKKLKELMKNRP